MNDRCLLFTNELLALLLGLLDLGEKSVGLAVESLLQDAASTAVNKLGELRESYQSIARKKQQCYLLEVELNETLKVDTAV